MIKHGIDQDALITQFSQATAQQGEALRKLVNETTLRALQGRELTLSNMKQVLGTVAKAASAGAADSPLAKADVEGLLVKTFAGMDAALVQAVQAHRTALQQLIDHGVSLRENHVKKALADLGKMEDSLFDAVRKAAGASLEGPWAAVLPKVQNQGTGTGPQARATVEQLMDTAQQSLREGRELGLKASQALLDSYATLVSGVLIGMSEALQPSTTTASSRARKT